MMSKPQPKRTNMYVLIDPESDQPVYEQIAQHIRIKIVNEELTGGARLVGIRRLATDLKVSYTTVMSAYHALAEEGFIEITPRGAYVLSRRADGEPSLDKGLLHTFKRTLLQLWQAGASPEWIHSQTDREIPAAGPSRTNEE